MSGKLVSESHLSCAVCFEKYRKPQSLKCGHIFCTPCIEQLFKKQPTSDTILCPKCRAPSTTSDLRRDFAMQELVEVLEEPSIKRNTRQATTVRRNKVTCDVCGEGQWANFCEECDQYLCPQCTRMHGKIKAAKDHKLQNQESLMRPNLQLLSALRDEYTSNLNALTVKQVALSDEQLDEQTSAITEDIDKVLGKLTQKRDELLAAFRTEKLEHVMKAEKLSKSIAATRSTLQESIKTLDDVIKTKDVSILFNSKFLDKMKSEFKEKNAKFEKAFEEYATFDDTFRCSLFVPPTLLQHIFIARDKRHVQVTAPPVAYGRIAQFTDPGVLRPDTILQEMNNPIKIRAVGGGLWVHGFRGIHVIGANGEQTRVLKIKLKSGDGDVTFDNVWDSAETATGNIVIAADTSTDRIYDGLYHVAASTGEVLNEVTRGRFSSLAASGSEIYAMQMNEHGQSCTISAFAHSDSRWRLISSVSLSFAAGLESISLGILPTFQVQKNLIYLCDTKRVLVYTSSGAYCFSHNLPISCPKSDHFWRLTDVDADTNLLLIEHNMDSGSGRLVVCDHNNVVTQLSVESMNDPNDACADCQGWLWVLDNDNDTTRVYRSVSKEQGSPPRPSEDRPRSLPHPLPSRDRPSVGEANGRSQRPVSDDLYANTTRM